MPGTKHSIAIVVMDVISVTRTLEPTGESAMIRYVTFIYHAIKRMSEPRRTMYASVAIYEALFLLYIPILFGCLIYFGATQGEEFEQTFMTLMLVTLALAVLLMFGIIVLIADLMIATWRHKKQR